MAARYCREKRLNSAYVAQVEDGAAGTTITNTGTQTDGEPIDIFARLLRPSASEGLDASLARRSIRLMELISR